MAISREVSDHRRRMLDYQEKVEAELRASRREVADPQLKMPLVGEARRPRDPSPAKRGRLQGQKPVQLKFDE